MWGGNLNNTRSANSSALINQTSVSDLAVVWKASVMGGVSASPLVYGGVTVFPTWAGQVYSLNSSTGSVKWQFTVDDYVNSPLCEPPTQYNLTASGVISRTSPALISEDTIVIGTQFTLISLPLAGLPYLMGLSLSTGNLLWCTLADEQAFAVITQSGTPYNGSFYVGVSSQSETLPVEETFFRGSFLKINAADGEIEWQTFLEPEVDEGYAGAAVWGSMPPVDPIRRQVYVATGNNYKVPPEYTQCQLDRSTTTEECGLPANYADSVLALDLDTGDIKWAVQLGPLESWTYACIGALAGGPLNLTGVDIYLPTTGVDLSDPASLQFSGAGLPGDLLPPGCPAYPGSDADFAQAPMLTYVPALDADLLLVANKGGFAFAVDPDSGEKLWATAVGPGGFIGGAMWGSATDGERMYVAINTRAVTQSSSPVQKPSAGSPNMTSNGLWAALDASTGEVLWETASPLTGSNAGQLTVANGVLFGATASTLPATNASLFAINVTDGTILNAVTLDNYQVQNSPSIVDNVLYQGTGYSSINGLATAPNAVTANAFWAFTPVGNPVYPTATPAKKLEGF